MAPRPVNVPRREPADSKAGAVGREWVKKSEVMKPGSAKDQARVKTQSQQAKSGSPPAAPAAWHLRPGLPIRLRCRHHDAALRAAR
jgi:hypothetical protein